MEQISMEQMLNVLVVGVMAILGVLSHFLKKKVTGQSLDDIKEYFSGHFKDTALMLIGTVIGVGMLFYFENANFHTAFLTGYTADSLFNKGKQDEMLKEMIEKEKEKK